VGQFDEFSFIVFWEFYKGIWQQEQLHAGIFIDFDTIATLWYFSLLWSTFVVDTFYCFAAFIDGEPGSIFCIIWGFDASACEENSVIQNSAYEIIQTKNFQPGRPPALVNLACSFVYVVGRFTIYVQFLVHSLMKSWMNVNQMQRTHEQTGATMRNNSNEANIVARGVWQVNPGCLTLENPVSF
jgi:hypothetical protein